jgi:hypothetical protein
MSSQDAIRSEREQTDRKIDGLFGLLAIRPSTSPAVVAHGSQAPKPNKQAPAPTPAPGIAPSMQAHLTVSQSPKISTRPDTPNETEVVVQTDKVFSSLKFAMQCDKPLVDANPSVGGGTGSVQMMVGGGVLRDRPNVVVYSYGSSVPPIWASKPVGYRCVV